MLCFWVLVPYCYKMKLNFKYSLLLKKRVKIWDFKSVWYINQHICLNLKNKIIINNIHKSLKWLYMTFFPLMSKSVCVCVCVSERGNCTFFSTMEFVGLDFPFWNWRSFLCATNAWWHDHNIYILSFSCWFSL